MNWRPVAASLASAVLIDLQAYIQAVNEWKADMDGLAKDGIAFLKPRPSFDWPLAFARWGVGILLGLGFTAGIE